MRLCMLEGSSRLQAYATPCATTWVRATSPPKRCMAFSFHKRRFVTINQERASSNYEKALEKQISTSKPDVILIQD